MIDVPSLGLEVDNPAEVLREQEGIFEVTSPYGHVFQVICRRGRKMDIQEICEPEHVENPHGMLWRIRRVAARSAAA
jgi:hypothetical protein